MGEAAIWQAVKSVTGASLVEQGLRAVLCLPVDPGHAPDGVAHYIFLALTQSALETRDMQGNPGGSFGASDLVVGLSWGRWFSGTGIQPGLTVKHIRQTIADSQAASLLLGIGHRLYAKRTSIGIGMGWRPLSQKISLDYAFAPGTSQLGNTHRLTFGLEWGQVKRESARSILRHINFVGY